MTDINYEGRITTLEVISRGHADDIKELKDTSKALSDVMAEIKKSIDQIKWIAVGAFLVLFSEAFGFEQVIKNFIKF